jgi:beta-lactamase class A
MLVICLLIVGGAAVAYHQFVSPTNAPAAVRAAQTHTVSAAQSTQLDTQINQLIATNDGVDISVSIIDPQTGVHKHYGETAGYQAASTAKLLTATYYLHEVEQGQLGLNQTINGQHVQSLLQAMIVQSDDNAWADLNDTLGHSELATYAASLGITDYNVSNNVLSSDDIARILQKLQSGALLNSAHTALLRSYMQQANYRSFIVAAAPSGYTVYHKAGETDDEVHDAAIITHGSESLILVIFTNGHGTYDWDARTQLIQTITTDALHVYLPS